MTTTIYSSTDAGAPNGTSLIGVLDALVAGYGTKPACGLTKIFSGTNKAAYRLPSGTSQRVLRVDETGPSNFARFVGYSTMTDVDTGTLAFPSESAIPGGLNFYKGSGVAAWRIITNGKYLHILWNPANNPTYYGYGDLLPLNTGGGIGTFIHGASVNSSITTFQTLQQSTNTPASGSFLHQSFTGIGSGVGAGKVADAKCGAGLGLGWGSLPNKDGVLSTIEMSQVRVFEAGGSDPNDRGIIPGLLAPCFNASQFNQGDVYPNSTTGRTYEFWRIDNQQYGLFVETSQWA
jgi:hypothetical protein